MVTNPLFGILLESIDDSTVGRVRDVIKNHDDATTRGEYEETCLHVLCSPQHSDKVQYLVPLAYILTEAGIDVNAQDQEGNTVLHVCVINDSPRLLTLTFLRLGADPTIVNKYDMKPEDCGEENGVVELINNYSPGLYTTVKEGKEELVKQMVSDWFHIDRKLQGQKLDKVANKNGYPALQKFIKANKSQCSFVRAVYCGNEEKVKEMVDKLDSVDLSDEAHGKKWPLIAEAWNLKYVEVVKILLKKSDVNQLVETHTGQTVPLFQFILESIGEEQPSNFSRFIKTLLKKANLSLYDGWPVEQLYNFWKKGFPDQIVTSYSNSSSFSLASRLTSGFTLRDLILLESYPDQSQLGKRLGFVDKVVIKMVKHGDVAGVQKLVLEGYRDVLVRDDKGRSTLQLAQSTESEDMGRLLKNIPVILATISNIYKDIRNGNLQGVKRKMVTDLVEGHDLAECRDGGGRSPLHMAVLYDRKYVIHHLVKTYPNSVHCRDSHGRTALHYACCLDDGHDIENILIHAGVDPTLLDDQGKTGLDYKISNSDIIQQERTAKYNSDAHLLSTYVLLCDVIKHDDQELFRLILDNMDAFPIDDVNKLPEVFGDLEFVPLLSVCISHDRETMATLLLRKGENFYCEWPAQQQASVLEESENAGMFELSRLLKIMFTQPKANQASSRRPSWQERVAPSYSSSLGSWRDDSRSSVDSLTPPPHKRSNRGTTLQPLLDEEEGESIDSEDVSEEVNEVQKTRSGSCVIL